MTTERSPSEPDTDPSAWVYSDVMQPLDVRIRTEVTRQLNATVRVFYATMFAVACGGTVAAALVMLLLRKMGWM